MISAARSSSPRPSSQPSGRRRTGPCMGSDYDRTRVLEVIPTGHPGPGLTASRGVGASAPGEPSPSTGWGPRPARGLGSLGTHVPRRAGPECRAPGGGAAAPRRPRIPGRPSGVYCTADERLGRARPSPRGLSAGRGCFAVKPRAFRRRACRFPPASRLALESCGEGAASRVLWRVNGDGSGILCDGPRVLGDGPRRSNWRGRSEAAQRPLRGRSEAAQRPLRGRSEAAPLC